jgi:hypothetical protein
MEAIAAIKATKSTGYSPFKGSEKKGAWQKYVFGPPASTCANLGGFNLKLWQKQFCKTCRFTPPDSLHWK